MISRLALASALLLVLAPSTVADAPMTPPESRALARAINLSSADLPGYQSAPAPRTREGQREEARVARCAHAAPRARRLAAVDSRMFGNEASGEATLFQSNVSVWESPELALREFRAETSARARRCILASIRRVDEPGLRVVRASVTAQPAAFPGMVAVRIRLVYSYEGQRYSSISDAVVFQRGTAVVSVSGQGSPHSVDAAVLADLVDQVRQRAEAELP